MNPELRIGTSGWHYKHWLGNFYPERLPQTRMLEYYLRFFDTVEINNSFYGLPVKTGLEKWRDQTPADFCFAAKGSRFLTHMKKLKDPEPGIAKYFDHLEVLGEKLGPILFQLPPNWRVDVARLEAFLQALPDYHRYAFEFREPTWHTEEVYRLLERHNAAFCIYHLAGFESPDPITAAFTYIRLHGPGGKYQGSYDAGALQSWARRISEWRSRGKGVFVYFDNDDSGFAPRNALTLRELCGV